MAGMRSPMRNPMRSALDQALGTAYMSLANQALAILRKFGTDAHVYLPGSTVTTYGPESWVDSGVTFGGESSKVSTGVYRVYSSAGGYSTVIGGSMVVGRTYTVTFNVDAAPVGGSGLTLEFLSNLTTTSALGAKSVTGVATGTTMSIKRTAGVTDIQISNISVREVITTSSVTAGLPTNNYTLSDGSTGYSAVDGTAGLVLDGAGSVGAELVTNGGFDVDANWTKGAGWSITGGAAVASGATANLTQAGVAPSPVGKTYKVTVSIPTYTSGSISPQIGGSIKILSAAGDYTFYLTPTGADATLYIATAGFTGTVDNVSVKEVTGIHATQATTANKPALRRGLYNLSVESDNFGGAATSFVNASYSGGKLLDSALSGQHRMDRAMTSAAGPQTFLALVKYGDYQWASIRIGSNGASFDLANGVVGTVVSGAGASRSIANAGNGYYLLAFSDPAALANTTCRVNNESADGVGSTFTGTGALGTYVSRVGLVSGVITAQQALSEGGIPLTTSAAASNSSAGRYSWSLNGTSSSLLTGNMGITNAVSITVSGRLDSLASVPRLFAEDTNGLELYVSAAGQIALGKTGVGPLATSSAGDIVVGETFVISAVLSGGTATIRKNSVQKASSATGQVGAATTGARIGASFAGANFVSGTISAVDVLVANVSTQDLLTIERNVAANTPTAPSF